MIIDLNIVLILILAFLHLSAGKISLPLVSQSRWLSASSGVAITFVFLELLPNLNESKSVLDRAQLPFTSLLTNYVYLLALMGLITFYGLELLAMRSRHINQMNHGNDITSPFIFWIHIGSYSIYNALFSYLLNHTARAIDCLLLFGAIAFHYLGNDHKLRLHHKRLYDKVGRWVLAGAILSGWLLSQWITQETTTLLEIELLRAFLAGGVILNVLSNEIPRDDRCFGSFLAGTGAYATTLLLLSIPDMTR